jgi:hypothetical protein
MLMFTSCGWFFDEVSGIETVKVIEYAARVIQLADELFEESLEPGFLERLQAAVSNLSEQRNAAEIYRRQVRPAMAGLDDVAAHYAISSLFERTGEDVPIFCYSVDRQEYETHEAGPSRLGVGRARITSNVTLESAMVTFAALHLGGHNVAAGIRRCLKDDDYAAMKGDILDSFSRADLPEVLRALDRHFGKATYSLRSLFGDQRKKILDLLLESSVTDAENAYRRIYDRHAPLLRFLGASGMEKPAILSRTAEFVLNANLQAELDTDWLDASRVRGLVEQAETEKIQLDKEGLGFTLQHAIIRQMERFCDEADDLDLLRRVSNSVQLSATLGLPVNLWRVQNIYWEMAHRQLHRQHNAQWRVSFLTLGEKLGIETQQFAKVLGAPAA